jgi:hypothetical protein
MTAAKEIVIVERSKELSRNAGKEAGSNGSSRCLRRIWAVLSIFPQPARDRSLILSSLCVCSRDCGSRHMH